MGWWWRWYVTLEFCSEFVALADGSRKAGKKERAVEVCRLSHTLAPTDKQKWLLFRSGQTEGDKRIVLRKCMKLWMLLLVDLTSPLVRSFFYCTERFSFLFLLRPLFGWLLYCNSLNHCTRTGGITTCCCPPVSVSRFCPTKFFGHYRAKAPPLPAANETR